jgi:hypothetical protein
MGSGDGGPMVEARVCIGWGVLARGSHTLTAKSVRPIPIKV